MAGGGNPPRPIRTVTEMTMNRQILVVDDSEIVLEVARDTLEEAGFEVATATCASEVDSHITATGKPALIIMDVMLPGISGDKKTWALKHNSSTSSIPVLLLSSKSEEDLVRLVRESGADGYIRKPFTEGEMIAAVGKILNESKA